MGNLNAYLDFTYNNMRWLANGPIVVLPFADTCGVNSLAAEKERDRPGDPNQARVGMLETWRAYYDCATTRPGFEAAKGKGEKQKYRRIWIDPLNLTTAYEP